MDEKSIAAVAQKVSKAMAEYNAKVEKHYVQQFENVEVEKTKINLRVLLLIDPIPVHLVAHMSRLPSDYAYWGMVMNSLDDTLTGLRYDYDVWHADKYDVICRREDLPRTATESYKESAITVSYGAEQMKMKSEISLVESAIRKVKVLLKALEFKKDMLQSIGKIIREEMESVSMTDGAVLTSRDAGSRNLKNIRRR